MTGFAGESLRAAEDFAAQMGLPCRPARDGSVSFVFAQTGTLTLTPGEDGEAMHVSLMRRPARVDPETARSALAAAGLDASSGHLIHVGLTSDEDLIFSVRLARGEVSPQAIESALDLLRQRHDILP